MISISNHRKMVMYCSLHIKSMTCLNQENNRNTVVDHLIFSWNNVFGLTNAWTRDSYFIITVVSKNRVSELTIKNWHLVLVCTSVRRWDKSGGKGRQARGQPDDIWARLQGERENRGDKHLLIGRKTLERFCSFFFFGALIWNTGLVSGFKLSVFLELIFWRQFVNGICKLKGAEIPKIFYRYPKIYSTTGLEYQRLLQNNRNAVPRGLSSNCFHSLQLPPKWRKCLCS